MTKINYFVVLEPRRPKSSSQQGHCQGAAGRTLPCLLPAPTGGQPNLRALACSCTTVDSASVLMGFSPWVSALCAPPSYKDRSPIELRATLLDLMTASEWRHAHKFLHSKCNIAHIANLSARSNLGVSFFFCFFFLIPCQSDSYFKNRQIHAFLQSIKELISIRSSDLSAWHKVDDQ